MHVSFLLLVALLAFGQPPPERQLPSPGGPLPIGRQSFFWTDAARPETESDDPEDHRELRADIWYPAASLEKVAEAPLLGTP